MNFLEKDIQRYIFEDSENSSNITLWHVHLKAFFIKDTKNIRKLNTHLWAIFCFKDIEFYMKYTVIFKLKKYLSKVVLIFMK